MGVDGRAHYGFAQSLERVPGPGCRLTRLGNVGIQSSRLHAIGAVMGTSLVGLDSGSCGLRARR